MTKIVSIHQPSYFPWLGLLNKVYQSHLYVCLDNVQLADRAYQHRNMFLQQNGDTKTLTVNIQKKNYRLKTIKEIELANETWQKKHQGFLLANYKKHPFFDEIYSQVKFIFEKKYTYLLDVLLDSMRVTFDLFDIKVETVMQSSLKLESEVKKTELILDVLQATKATDYLSGEGAKAYQNDNAFKNKGVNIHYNQFSHPKYPQQGVNFVAGLASLDLLFNLGQQGARELLKTSVTL